MNRLEKDLELLGINTKKKKRFILCILMTAVIFVFFCSFTIRPITTIAEEETQEEVIEEQEDAPEEKPEETPEEKQGYTFEDFLAYTQKLAEDYGYGEQYGNAVNNIKNAITQKQFSVVIIGDILVVVLLAVSIFKKAKRDKRLEEVAKQLKSLTNGTNDIVNATNSNTDKNTDLVESQTALAQAIQCIVFALRSFFKCVKLPEEQKKEVLTSCDKALTITEKKDDKSKLL